ncbi:pimeloyl-ACP methyl ester carboxylesterase [Bosea sp. OAE752]
MWRFVVPYFEATHRIVLLDPVGAGQSDSVAYDPVKYSNLAGYADNLAEVADELALSEAILVGHSLSAMIGALASIEAQGRFGKLVMVCPSPRYIDDGNYRGGFSRKQIEALLDFLALNYQGCGDRDHGQSCAAGASSRAEGKFLPGGP